MKSFVAWMALVFTFGASGRVLGIETETYEQKAEMSVVIPEVYRPVYD